MMDKPKNVCPLLSGSRLKKTMNKMNQTKQQILAYCLKNPTTIMVTELAETLQLSNRTVTKYLLELVATGRMTQTGINYQWVDLAKRNHQCLFVYKKRQVVGYLYFPRGPYGSRYEFLYANEYLGQADAETLSSRYAPDHRTLDLGINFQCI